jgi:cell fate regulator YaaT (PSP1 superfamily)
VEYQGDSSKITFYYTADNRVDFRQLIKDYAGAFRTKIDMKQIGFRQEAAKVGGIGSCGRELCCSTWLTDFRSVNTNVARYQQLSINPQKLAGQCGKLKCCLNYELDSYLDALSNFPSSSTTLETEKGKAFCIKIDVFKKKMWFAYVDSSIAWYDFDIDLVKKLISKNKRGEKTLPLEDLKQPETSTHTIDLIQENNVDRFEKKNRGNRNRNNQNKQNNGQQGSQNQGQGQGQKRNRPERQERSEKTENPNAQSANQPKPQKQHPQQKGAVEKAVNNSDADKKPQSNPNKKKFKKKYPPKKDNNA